MLNVHIKGSQKFIVEYYEDYVVRTVNDNLYAIFVT